MIYFFYAFLEEIMLNFIFFGFLFFLFFLSLINQYLPVVAAVVVPLVFWEIGLPLKRQKFDFGDVYVISVDAINAFSIGKNIVFTKGLLDKISLDGIRGAYYHELAHVKFKDQVSSLLIFLSLYLIGLLISIFRKDIQYPYMFSTFLFMIWIRWQMELRADRYAALTCGSCIEKVLSEIGSLNTKRSFIGMILHPPLEYRLKRLRQITKKIS